MQAKSFNAGSMREEIAFLSLGQVQSNTGAIRKEYTQVFTDRAAVEPLTGKELFESRMLKDVKHVRFIMRFRHDLNEQMRILWAAKQHEIVSITPAGPDRRKRWLEILTREVIKP